MTRLSYSVPFEMVGFVAILTSIFAMNFPAKYAGVPAYARVTLLVLAILDLITGVTHWLYLPDAGLESVANLVLGPPSPARTIAIAVHRKEGQERFWLSCVLIYIACYAPQLTFMLLKFLLLRMAVGELTDLILKPFSHKGESLATNTPEKYGFFVDCGMIGVPLLYAYYNSEIQ